MKDSSPPKPGQLVWYQRTIMAVFGVGIVAVLCVAAWLSPNPQGHGTHQDLGLEPCSFIQWFGFRCPSCGMTTSWAHVMEGNLIGAVKANTGGTLLAMIAVVTGPWVLVSAAIGKWLFRRPNEWVIVAIAILVVLVTIVDWTVRTKHIWWG